MDVLSILDHLRNGSPFALIIAGFGLGFGVAWFILRQQIATYKAKLEHAQDVVDGKIPPSTYRPIRFKKERPVIIGIALAIVGIIAVAAGIILIAANLKAVSPARVTSDALKETAEAKQEEGPLVWFYNLTMEGGPLQSRNVFSLQFRGWNKSDNEVRLKSATIISSIDGAELTLEIVAGNEVVPITDIGLIPSKAQITLVAKFGPPDSNAPGKILGIDPKPFLETWRQFTLNVEDDTRKYRVQFTENSIAPFFSNMVGPHVTKK
jgi:hypothetical protein